MEIIGRKGKLLYTFQYYKLMPPLFSLSEVTFICKSNVVRFLG